MISKYIISGMTCGRCAAHITEEVSELDGVTGVNVSYEDARMLVESEDRPPFDAIIEAVSEAGEYSVVEA
ncbi:MAG: heavy-metal-associated domain-containing protein [Arachnia sp.]